MATLNVRVTIVARRPFAEYDSAVAYMQDIEPGSLLQSIHDGVRNTNELGHYIPFALMSAKPVRDLEFNDGVRPNDVSSFGSKSLWENIQSCLVYITGNEVAHPGGKHACIKKFRKIVVPNIIYDYHFEDPDNLRKKFETSKHWACANHHYDCEWSRCEAWSLLGLPNPKIPRARARAPALPQPDTHQSDAAQSATPLSAAPVAIAHQSAALQAVIPQSVASQAAAPQYLASQVGSTQPVAAYTAHAQPGGQETLNHQLSGRGALPSTRRGSFRGISSRRSTQGAARSDRVRQTMLAHVSGGFTQSQPGAFSSAGSAGAGFQTSGSMAASYQASPYQTPSHTTSGQPTFDAMQSSLQVAALPGGFIQPPLNQPQSLGAQWSHNSNLQYSPVDYASQGFNAVTRQPGLLTGWNSQLRRPEQTNNSLLVPQLPGDRTVGLLQADSQGALFRGQQFSSGYVDPRQIMLHHTPQYGGQVGDTTLLRQQMVPQQVVDSAAGGTQDGTDPSRQDDSPVPSDTIAAEPPATSQQSLGNSREAENVAPIFGSSQQERMIVD